MSRINEYNVLILGPRGAGKTVFLASMYYKLCLPDWANFFIETESHFDGKRLKNIYANLSQEWPEANKYSHFIEYEFKCLLKTKAKNIEVFKIKYHDYSGGRLTDAVMDDENEFKDIIDNSDVLLGMIDGRNLLSGLKQNSYNSTFFTVDLEEIMSHIGTHHSKSKIVQLIISKWDLLTKEYSLKDVNEYLSKFPRFRQFASTIIGDGGKIRFVPVSSVGFNFADPLENGGMKIRVGGHLEPYNVQMPIVLTVLDPMKTAIEAIEEQVKIIEATQPIIDPKLTWWQRLLRGAGKLINEYSEKQRISNELLTQLANHWKSVGNNKIEAAKMQEEEIRANMKNKLELVTDEKTAIEYVFNSLHEHEKEFDKQHPYSLMGKI